MKYINKLIGGSVSNDRIKVDDFVMTDKKKIYKIIKIKDDGKYDLINRENKKNTDVNEFKDNGERRLHKKVFYKGTEPSKIIGFNKINLYKTDEVIKGVKITDLYTKPIPKPRPQYKSKKKNNQSLSLNSVKSRKQIESLQKKLNTLTAQKKTNNEFSRKNKNELKRLQSELERRNETLIRLQQTQEKARMVREFSIKMLRRRADISKKKKEKAIMEQLTEVAKLEAQRTIRMEELKELGGINKLKKMTAALGSPSQLNSNNLQEGLASLGSRLREKVECVVCGDTFYKDDTLDYGNDSRICVKRLPQSDDNYDPDYPQSCLENAINSAFDNFDGSLRYRKPADGEPEPQPVVVSEASNKILDINSVFSKLHPDGQKKYLNAIKKFYLDKLTGELQEKHSENKTIAVEKAVEEYREQMQENARYNELIREVDKYVRQDGILMRGMMRELYQCKFCGAVIGLQDGCNAMTCSNCNHATCAICMQDFGAHGEGGRSAFDRSHAHFPGYPVIRGVTKYCSMIEPFREFARKNNINLGPDFPLYAPMHTVDKFREYASGLYLIAEIKKIENTNISNVIVKLLKENDQSVYWIRDRIVNDAMMELSIFNDLPPPMEEMLGNAAANNEAVARRLQQEFYQELN